MSSAQKSRKVGMFGGSVGAITSVVSSFARPHQAPTPLAPAHPTKNLKRSRDAQQTDDRITKQARRDSAVEDSIARSRAAIRSPIRSERERVSADERQKRALVNTAYEHLRRESVPRASSSNFASFERPGKSQDTTQAGPVFTPVSDRIPMEKTGFAPPSAKATSALTTEIVSVSTQSEEAAPVSQNTTEAAAEAKAQETSYFAEQQEITQLKKVLDEKAEELRAKNAQAKSMAVSYARDKIDSQKEIAALEAAVRDRDTDLEKKDEECKKLVKAADDDRTQAQGKYEELQEFKRQLHTQRQQAEREIKKRDEQIKVLSDEKKHLETQVKQAVEGEDRMRKESDQSRKARSAATEELDRTRQENDDLKSQQSQAQREVKSLTKACKALMAAINVIPNARILKHIPGVNLDIGMDALNSPEEYVEWRDYAELPVNMTLSAPADSASALAPASTFSAPAPAKTGGWNPSASSVKSPQISTFGKPSDLFTGPPKACSTSNTEVDDLHRTVLKLDSKVQAQDQELAELRDYRTKLSKGENPAPPMSPTERKVAGYAKNFLTDAFGNGMQTSSGELVRHIASDGDIGMVEAPGAVQQGLFSVSTDWSTFGHEPMNTDGVTFEKAVGRKNNKANNSQDGNGGNNASEDKGHRNKKNKNNWKNDNKAGRRNGLDAEMGDNDDYGQSAEEKLFQGGNKSGRGGKYNQNNNQKQSKWKHQSNDNHQNGGNRAGRGGRGGREGRGGGRGGSFVEGDAYGGAEDAHAANAETSGLFTESEPLQEGTDWDPTGRAFREEEIDPAGAELEMNETPEEAPPTLQLPSGPRIPTEVEPEALLDAIIGLPKKKKKRSRRRPRPQPAYDARAGDVQPAPRTYVPQQAPKYQHRHVPNRDDRVRTANHQRRPNGDRQVGQLDTTIQRRPNSHFAGHATDNQRHANPNQHVSSGAANLPSGLNRHNFGQRMNCQNHNVYAEERAANNQSRQNNNVARGQVRAPLG